MSSADALILLADAMVHGPAGAVERQEAHGQQLLTSTFTRLPIEMDHDRSRALGFEVGHPLDELFVGVTAPAGWELKPTEHSMWSDIIDADGKKCGEVFYKAAFYDRRAEGYWQK